LIQYQILRSNIRRVVWQMVRGITNEILGVKGQVMRIKKNINYEITNGPDNTSLHLHFDPANMKSNTNNDSLLEVTPLTDAASLLFITNLSQGWYLITPTNLKYTQDIAKKEPKECLGQLLLRVKMSERSSMIDNFLSFEIRCKSFHKIRNKCTTSSL
ncbi:hypothetical protein pdam_00011043, partial [Pocillopora damicornis]